MTKQDVVDNLFALAKSNPDKNARLAKANELQEYLSTGTGGADLARSLINRLPMLIETSGADSGTVRSSTDIQYIRSVQDQIDDGNPNHEIHKLVFSQLGIKAERQRVSQEEFHPLMVEKLVQYKAQCAAEGKPFDPQNIPYRLSLNDGPVSYDLYTYMRKVYKGGYNTNPRFLAVAPRLERLCNTTFADALSYEDLARYLDDRRRELGLQLTDLDPLLPKFCGIYKDVYGYDVPLNDPHAQALLNTSGDTTINNQVLGALNVMTPMPLDKLTDADRKVVQSIVILLLCKLSAAEADGSNRMSATDLDDVCKKTYAAVEGYLSRFSNMVPPGRRISRFTAFTDGNEHSKICGVARDKESVNRRLFLQQKIIGLPAEAAHASVKLAKQTIIGCAMLSIRFCCDQDGKCYVEVNFCTSRQATYTLRMREGRRVFNFNSDEVIIPAETIRDIYHLTDLNALERFIQEKLKAKGGFLDGHKFCFAKESDRPPSLPALATNSKKKETTATKDAAIVATIDEQCEAVVETIKALPDVPDVYKAALVSTCWKLAGDGTGTNGQVETQPIPAPPGIVVPSPPNATAAVLTSPSDLAALVATASAALAASGNLDLLEHPQPQLQPLLSSTRSRRGGEELMLPPAAMCEAENTILRQRVCDLEQQLELRDIGTTDEEEDEKHASISATEAQNAQSSSATSSPMDDDDSDDDSDSGDEEEEVEVGTILSSGQYHVHQHETSATVRIAELEQERDEALQKVEEARSHAERVKGLLQQERTKSAEMSGQAQQATTSLQSVRMRIGRLERDKKLAEGSLANAESQVAPPGPARRL